MSTLLFYRAKALLHLPGDDWPDTLLARQIARLQYPNETYQGKRSQVSWVLTGNLSENQLAFYYMLNGDRENGTVSFTKMIVEGIGHTPIPEFSRTDIADWLKLRKIKPSSLLSDWLGEDNKTNDNPLETKPSYGTKAIHKLINRAFYLVANTEEISDITPSAVMDAIKNERRDTKKQLQIDVESIIKCIEPDANNGGYEIHWATSSRKTSKPFTYRAFTDCVNYLKKANTAN